MYGGITSRGVTPLFFIKGKVTSQRYIEKILTPMIANIESRRKVTNNILTTKLVDKPPYDYIFEQDHASSHTANATQEWCLNNINGDWMNKDEAPSKMDDVWAIERIWGVMTYKVYGGGQKQPKSLKELETRIKKAWKTLDAKMLRRAVHQMKLRMREIVFKKGEKLTYFKQHC